MSSFKICPKCGTPQQWELWRQCICGFDFGLDSSVLDPPNLPEICETETSVAKPSVPSRRGCLLALIVIFLVPGYLLIGPAFLHAFFVPLFFGGE